VCSLAFFRKEHAVPFRSDIPGRPETQVGRWHAMRRTGKERTQSGEVELTEDVEWERIWRPRPEGNVVPPALEGLRWVCTLCCSRLVMTCATSFDRSQKKGRSYDYHSHRQCPSGSQ
jgi:hypothetical protein